MTKQELIAQLEAYEFKQISYTVAQTISAIGSASQEEKTSLTDAINALDKGLIGDIILTLFQAKRTADAKSIVAGKIVNNKIDLDEITLALSDK